MVPDVPDGWSLLTLNELGSVRKCRGGSKRDEVAHGLPVVRYGELYTRHHEVIRDFYSFLSAERSPEYTELEPGDVLFAGSGETLDEIGKSAVFLGPAPAFASGDIVLLRPGPQLDPLFAGYATNGPDAVRQKARVGQGSSVMHIYAHSIGRLRLLVPPLPEQRKIAEILSSVDDAITATQRVISQTDRVKKGLLQTLTTRGIGHTRFKQTVIGEIPEAWKVARLGELFRRRQEGGLKGLPTLAVTLDAGLVRREQLERRIDSELSVEDHLLVRDRDLVYNTMRMWQGGCGFAGEDGIVSPAYVVAATKGALRSEYASFLFQSRAMINRFFSFSQGITRDRLRLYWDHFSMVRMALPSPTEQREIAEVLASVEIGRDGSNRNLLRLTRLKRGLMQDLLTGRVRVQVT
ncbi:restriction endonuclease subunit S [Gaopeijia maritima]|uniref:Restriction endonuclease subunit S n=1 Tax=Gaopeijia maritima TaxID=3119007 RepID=A0ABU9E5Z5_9BACT